MSILASVDYANTFVNGSQTNGQVFIKLTDPTTESPVNGNNIIIYYDQKIGSGAVTHEQVTISGQSKAIYSGLIQDTSTSFYTSFTITGQSAVPDPAPPVSQCDLEISYIDVVSPETIPGAGDGEILVQANSSFEPIEYSLDGTTFQSSNRFTDLPGGNKTVHVRDANTIGCAATQDVFIPTNANLLLSDPAVTLPNGNVSRWNAAFNPVVFTYQRKDYQVTGVSANEDGKAVISVNGNMANLKAGDLVFVNAGVYTGTFNVVAVSGSSIIIDRDYTVAATGFININSLRPYYKVLTEISYINPVSGSQDTIISTNRPDSKGLTRADIANFLQSIIRPKDRSDYLQINYRDDSLSASYTIRYAETWDGHNPQYISIIDPFYVVYAAKQLGDNYGGNLAPYVPYRANSLAKWVTDFKEPVYNNDQPFDIGFIYGEQLAGLELYYKIKQLDINRQQINVNDITVVLLNEDDSFLTNQDNSKLIIASQDLFDRPIVEHVGLNRLLINQQFSPNVYYLTVAIYYNDVSSNPVQVTELQTIRVDKEIQLQSFYLRWIGLSGSWNYYRFYYNQQFGLEVNNAIVVKNYIYDYAAQDGVEDVISKIAGQKVKLYAEDLSVNDIKGLQSLKYSPKVQMLVNKNPVKWLTVIVNTSTFDEYETLNGQAPFTITVNFPSINIQNQIALNKEPLDVLAALEAVDELSEQINKREDDCLNRVFTRFCLLRGLAINPSIIRRKNFTGSPNYWEYLATVQTLNFKDMTTSPSECFLMSRELILDNGVPKLNIIFSVELIKEGE